MGNKVKILILCIIIGIVIVCFSSCRMDVTMHIVDFEHSDGKIILTQAVPDGSVLSKPDIFGVGRYKIVGWYKNIEHTEEWDFTTEIVTNDLTIFLKLLPVIVGDIGPAGGYIFFIDEDDEFPDWDCLEAAPGGWYGSNRDPSFQWGANHYIVNPSAKSVDIGKGQSNTSSIVDYHDSLVDLYPQNGDFYTNPTNYYSNSYSSNNGTVAAKVCEEAIINGYDDWFLPSRDELNLMYLHLKRNDIGEFGGNYSSACYWSSSEAANNNIYGNDYGNYAWGQYFHSGLMSKQLKYESLYIRPIRAF